MTLRLERFDIEAVLRQLCLDKKRPKIEVANALLEVIQLRFDRLGLHRCLGFGNSFLAANCPTPIEQLADLAYHLILLLINGRQRDVGRQGEHACNGLGKVGYLGLISGLPQDRELRKVGAVRIGKGVGFALREQIELLDGRVILSRELVTII